MTKIHTYKMEIKWTGNRGHGTQTYQSYSRDHEIHALGKVPISGSSDPSFLGDKKRYNPEELFLASIASCHMLWYLHLCTVNGIVVVDYSDHPEGHMVETPNGSGHFTEVMLNPEVTLLHKDNVQIAEALHHKANEMCFIANSCNFKIQHSPTTLIKKYE